MEAQHLLDAFPVPTHDLDVSSPARAWRQSSATAQLAVEAVQSRRAALAAEDGSDYRADPERLHAEAAYLAARAAQLHREHDALGRFAVPVTVPDGLPDDLADMAAGLAQRRLSEAFGSPGRARQVLDGRIAYLQQQPAQGQRQEDTSAEIALLEAVRRTLQAHPAGPAHMILDEGAIARRVQQAMSARAPEPSWLVPPAHERQRRTAAPSHAFGPEPGPPGLRP
ncbi:hypothetical protein [Streptomyces sp. NPDC101165]|uniref:hypothetical protein n=1 Tax=Streptomyces sp. NPDC101165 TaxID=3366119 RepID=UPI00381275B0